MLLSTLQGGEPAKPSATVRSDSAKANLWQSYDCLHPKRCHAGIISAWDRL